MDYRHNSNISVYIVAAIVVVGFLIYFALKNTMKDSPLGFAFFWFSHIACFALAIVILIYGIHTYGVISTSFK